MIVNKELIGKIKEYFDLNIYETKVWVALLSKGIASAGEISEVSEVPRSRTYDVLDSLEKKGFAIEKIGKPTQYIAVKPSIVIEKMKKNSYKQAKEKVTSLENLKNTDEYGKLLELHEQSFDPVKKDNVSGALSGKRDIHTHAREIVDEAEQEVLVCTSAEELLQETRSFRKILKQLEDKDVKVRLALNGDEEDLDKVSQLYDIEPEKVDLDTKFFLVDRQKILFNLNKPGQDEQTAVWLNSEFFTNAFAQLFETTMDKSS